MGIHICGAPCCWGVDDITNPHLAEKDGAELAAADFP